MHISRPGVFSLNPDLRRLLGTYLPRHRPKLVVAMLAMLVVSVCMSLSAYYLQPLFDKGLIGQRAGVLNTIVLALVGLTLLKGAAYFVQGYYMEYIGQRIIADLQQDLYAKLVTQDLTFYQQNPTAILTARFISDLLRLKQCVTQIFSSGLRDTAIILGLLANMLYHNWALTLLSVLILPPTAIVIGKTGRLMRKYARLNQERTGTLAHLLNQTLGHIRQVQSYTQEPQEQQRVNASIEDVFDSSVRAGRVRAYSSPIVEIIGTLVIGFMILFAGYQIQSGELTPGGFASFMASLVIIIRPIKGLTALNHILQEGIAAAQRTFAVMDTPVQIKTQLQAPALQVRAGKVEYNHITFTYPDGTVALQDVSFTIEPGQTVALVGPSGAGKSTVLNLLPRFFDPTAGEILIDGQAIRAVDVQSLRRNIALVSQDVAIFDTSATENIRYGNHNATLAQVQAAAEQAAAHNFISNLPAGYDSALGENGVKLSGGQKQRIAIARALLKDAPILLLDEATSNLDTASEQMIQSAFDTLRRGRSTLIIAHRLSTIVNADVIHVLAHGQIVESGTHEHLLRQNGNYAELWRLQGQAEGAA